MTYNSNYQDPHDFDEEIVEIENELLAFFVDNMVKISGRDPILSKVMALFFTRKKMTQLDLQKLTKLSAGTISKTVRQLKDMKIIKQEMIPGTHKHIYIMEKLPYGSPAYIMNAEQLMGGMSDDIGNMKQNLDFNKEKMKDLDGFDKVYSIISDISRIMTTVPQFIKILEKELDEFLNK